MKIALISSEAVPYSKTGGLADVAGTLFAEFNKAGVDASLFVPLYKVTAEKYGKSLVDTGAEIDVPVGPTIKKCRVFTEAAKASRKERGSVFFIASDEYFGRDELYCTAEGDYPDNDARFVFFCRSVLETCRKLDLRFDILHCNDWQTGLIPLYLLTLYWGDPVFKETRTVLTIHNLGYQGLFPASSLETTGLDSRVFNPEGVEFYGRLNFLKAGIIAADLVTTVSGTYAKEILSAENGFGLDGVLRKRAASLAGVLNGIDYRDWDPSGDAFLPATYSLSDPSGKLKCKRQLMSRCSFKGTKDTPLMSFVGRLSTQKGIGLLTDSLDKLMKTEANFFVLGKGEMRFQTRLAEYARKYHGRFYFEAGFDEELAHLAYAGSDIFLMPSRYEPCGLGQIIAMRYGAVPVAYRTGGLADTITAPDDEPLRLFCEKVYGAVKETGFLFGGYSAGYFISEVRKALCVYYNKDVWRKIMANGMKADFSWKKSVKKYLELYGSLAV